MELTALVNLGEPTFEERTDISDGNERLALCELEDHVEMLHPAAFAWALRCSGGDREAAEDTLQLTYLKIVDGRARFEGRSSFKTWFFAVVRRTAAEHRRRHFLRAFASSSLDWEAADSGGAHQELERREASEALQRALRCLSRRQQEILHLVFYAEMTIEAGAKVMGVSTGTARTHYERGKRELRRRLTGEASS